MISITCPHTGTMQTLGPHQRISSHRSRSGTVSYYRCGCGELVLDAPEGRHHARTPAVTVAVAC